MGLRLSEKDNKSGNDLWGEGMESWGSRGVRGGWGWGVKLILEIASALKEISNSSTSTSGKTVVQKQQLVQMNH